MSVTILAEIVNFTLSFFMWMLIGRLALGLISGGRETFFTTLFRNATLPVTATVRRITPRSVGDGHIPILSLPLLLALRILLTDFLK
jgi:hypothetical protein